jgi:hypothetical protein
MPSINEADINFVRIRFQLFDGGADVKIMNYEIDGAVASNKVIGTIIHQATHRVVTPPVNVPVSAPADWGAQLKIVLQL